MAHFQVLNDHLDKLLEVTHAGKSFGCIAHQYCASVWFSTLWDYSHHYQDGNHQHGAGYTPGAFAALKAPGSRVSWHHSIMIYRPPNVPIFSYEVPCCTPLSPNPSPKAHDVRSLPPPSLRHAEQRFALVYVLLRRCTSEELGLPIRGD